MRKKFEILMGMPIRNEGGCNFIQKNLFAALLWKFAQWYM
jgi:hypothetical protein